MILLRFSLALIKRKLVLKGFVKTVKTTMFHLEHVSRTMPMYLEFYYDSESSFEK